MSEDPKRARRELRAKADLEYRELISELSGLSRNEDMLKIQSIVKAHTERSSHLYPIVKKKLAQSSKDARHIRELVQIALDASKRIEATARPFDMKRIIYNLMREASDGEPTQNSERITTGEFAKFITEKYVHKCLRRAPTFEFFYGALRSEGLIVKERRKRAKIDTNDINKTNKTTATERNLKQEVEHDSTPREVEHIQEQIQSLARKKPDGVPFFSTLVDPSSFTQTVENIFHASFLIKDNKFGVKKGTDCKQAVLTQRDETQTEADATEGQQSVLSFTMNDFNRWISAYGIKRRAFPARDESISVSNGVGGTTTNGATANGNSSASSSSNNNNNTNGNNDSSRRSSSRLKRNSTSNHRRDGGDSQ